MFDSTFFGTKLGQASLASIAAMTAMIALTSQMNMVAETTDFAQPQAQPSFMQAELA